MSGLKIGIYSYPHHSVYSNILIDIADSFNIKLSFLVY